MKKLYRPLIKGTNWALAGLLTLLGFSNCDDSKGSVDMYGVPWKSYSIKGSVVDRVTGKPIEGIEVKIAIPDSLLIPYSDTWKTKTDDKGEYKLSNTPSSSLKDGIPVVAVDIDGDRNGTFASDTIYVNTKDGTHEPENPNKTWFNGEWVNTADFELEENK